MSLFDHPQVLRHAVLRKGLAFAWRPVSVLERLVQSDAAYRNRPPVIANALPKSGTHLLLQITRALPEARYRGNFIATQPSLTLQPRSPAQIARRLRALLPAETLGAHILPCATVRAAMDRVNALHLFICRDPRDVLMSEVFYLTQMNRWHRMHKHFKALPDNAARLTLALDGLDARYLECNARFLPYAGWLGDPATLCLRYEDLSGPAQKSTLERLVEAYRAHGGAVNNDLLARLQTAVQPEKSHTFRRGGSGHWSHGLSGTGIDRINTRLAPSLQAFGYAV
ncbi:MAG: hypothetical protein U1D35_12300 [Paracoccaceae bacterium]|nr:hypothetical protein [Paracoccaceae bacterium]